MCAWACPIHCHSSGDVTVGGDHASTHVGVDVLEGPNAVVIIAQKDLGMEGDVSFDTVRLAVAASGVRLPRYCRSHVGAEGMLVPGDRHHGAPQMLQG